MVISLLFECVERCQMLPFLLVFPPFWREKKRSWSTLSSGQYKNIYQLLGWRCERFRTGEGKRDGFFLFCSFPVHVQRVYTCQKFEGMFTESLMLVAKCKSACIRKSASMRHDSFFEVWEIWLSVNCVFLFSVPVLVTLRVYSCLDSGLETGRLWPV